MKIKALKRGVAVMLTAGLICSAFLIKASGERNKICAPDCAITILPWIFDGLRV